MLEPGRIADDLGWRASLDLALIKRQARTVLSRRAHQGPLLVQRPFYPEGGVCHVYILHPPGGVVAGDRLAVRVRAGPDSQGVITTPAAGKFYRSDGRQAELRQTLAIEPRASLEWLPQETIIYEGAQARLLTRVELAEGARFLGWEIVCLGRPAAGERFQSGQIRQGFELWLNGIPLIVEQMSLRGGAAELSAPWGLGGFPITGSLFAYPATAADLALAREVSSVPSALCSTSLLGEVLITRFLGSRAEQARTVFERVWESLRPNRLGRPACPPRIWST